MDPEPAQLRATEAESPDPQPPEAAEPDPARRVEQLERANRELMRVNAELARGRLGPRDSAAVALLARLQRAETRAERMERSVSWRVTAPLRVLKPLLKPLRPWARSLRERLRRRLLRR